MKALLIAVTSLMVLAACESEWDIPFEKYTIPAGAHYSTYDVELLQSDQLIFDTYFDQSAIYTSSTEENQWDTNKLLGFSDCNSLHHEHSARFGWRWLNDRIEIMAYCYVNGERIIEYIGSTQPGTTNHYELQLHEDRYRFIMDTTTVDIPRQQRCDVGTYYMLFPYFGGNDTAPHAVNIFIRRQY